MEKAVNDSTQKLIAGWLERCAHQSKVFINAADVSEWTLALGAIDPAKLDLAFRDFFEVGNYPAIRDIKAHVARQQKPHEAAPRPMPRSRPEDAGMATGIPKFDLAAAEFMNEIRSKLDWEVLPLNATRDDLQAQVQRYAEAAEAFWRKRGVTLMAIDTAREVEACWWSALETRRDRHRENEIRLQAERERKAALNPLPVKPVAVAEPVPVVADYDPEHPDEIPF